MDHVPGHLREKAALALTEAVTVLTDGFAPDEVYERAAKHFDEPELAQLIALMSPSTPGTGSQ